MGKEGSCGRDDQFQVVADWVGGFLVGDGLLGSCIDGVAEGYGGEG